MTKTQKPTVIILPKKLAKKRFINVLLAQGVTVRLQQKVVVR